MMRMRLGWFLTEVRRSAQDLMIGMLASTLLSKGDQASFELYFTQTLKLTTKAAYLEHRDALKQHIRIIAAVQKAHAVAMRQPGGDSTAQCRRAQGRTLINSLIALRRAGKSWSAAMSHNAREAQEVTAAA